MARVKNRSQAGWVVLTIFAYLLFSGMATGIVFPQLMREKTLEGMMAYMQSIQTNVFKLLLVDVIGLGGPLLVRFILEQSQPLPKQS